MLFVAGSVLGHDKVNFVAVLTDKQASGMRS